MKIFYKKSWSYFVNKEEFPNEVYEQICDKISDSNKQLIINLNQKDIITVTFKYQDSLLYDFSFLSKKIDTTLLNSLTSDLNEI